MNATNAMHTSSRRRFLSSALMALGLPALAPAGWCAASPQQLRVLIIGQSSDGHPPTTHEFMAGAKVLSHLLEHEPRLQVSVVQADDPWPAGPERIAKADAIVLLVTQGAAWMEHDNQRQAALRAFAARGGALIALHWSVGAKEASHIQGQLNLLGATRGGPQRKYQVLATELKRVAPSHPVLTGLVDFKVYDEMYYALDRLPGIQPLLNARIDGREEMVCWAWDRPDGGRSFGFVGIHFHANWQLPEYRRLIVQALLWSLRLPIPAAGVKADIDPEFLRLNGVLLPLPGPDTTRTPARN